MTLSQPHSAGLTLVEMIVALVVISIISLAVATIVSGAGNTSLYVTNGTDSVSQVETAFRRMMHNLRTCSQLTSPTNTNSAAPSPSRRRTIRTTAIPPEP